jgi:hypothetical protein
MISRRVRLYDSIVCNMPYYRALMAVSPRMSAVPRILWSGVRSSCVMLLIKLVLALSATSTSSRRISAMILLVKAEMYTSSFLGVKIR